MGKEIEIALTDVKNYKIFNLNSLETRKTASTLPVNEEIPLSFQLRFVKIGTEFRYFRTLM